MSTLTYAEVGATRFEPLPAGYQHLRVRHLIGGAEVFDAAAEAVLTWRMHRGIPAKVTAAGPRAEPGVRVTVQVGPMRAPCEVVWSVREDARAGFGYGTLPGHPEQGEESFLVERAADGRVWFSVTAFSRPVVWYARLGKPFVPVFQRAYAWRCARSLRRLVSVR
ncbi:DUF1990 family protein [Spirilliplanes yamanashiensis]|uniref:DUF1990 domain-containing protein n=1 Tax=Spirilliplanes yamanashiensis TaxID=42233 RepID=A0A8J3YBM6_9ACTN|nr:DUF1990 domain-containing protein [Spirilliplanes yamanashiensis]MDP9819144.1 uncharacterized protein (UPF0548 family) [Spirilliplanes yamanashiensis]GIJ05598.1 DUF1990 domain-containing protein [Spirilliplanes yamanashiensis]